jgi:hypothetical protein
MREVTFKDFQKLMAKRNHNWVWHYGRHTNNVSRICDLWWADREAIYQARKAREAAAEKKLRTANQQAALNKARRAKLLKALAYTEVSDA